MFSVIVITPRALKILVSLLFDITFRYHESDTSSVRIRATPSLLKLIVNALFASGLIQKHKRRYVIGCLVC